MTKSKKKKKQKPSKPAVNGNDCLSEQVRTAMHKYFNDMDGHEPTELYQLILSEVEIPLFETVLNYTEGNVTKAADMLGLNRGTLRNRLQKYNIE
jgi:Fis family transcriptional regulator